jgi:hypothetical protein
MSRTKKNPTNKKKSVNDSRIIDFDRIYERENRSFWDRFRRIKIDEPEADIKPIFINMPDE